MKISIVICTYNRASLLGECLSSLTEQTASNQDFEVLVINNNSTDETVEIAACIAPSLPNFRLITEYKQGLSHARNRGIEAARTDWIFYLDDDAKASKNMVARAIWMIENHTYDFFGGVYLPWYHYGQPKWYKEQFGSNKMRYKKVTMLPSGQYACGGIMVIRKSLLQKYKGFHPDIGMNGTQIGYGEETELQLRMRADGVQIAYDPELIMYHVVADYKLNVDWFFKAAFAHGRDNIIAKKQSPSLINLFVITLVLMAQVLIYACIATPKLLLQKSYYIENWLIDTFRKPTKRVGFIYTALLKKTTENDSIF